MKRQTADTKLGQSARNQIEGQNVARRERLQRTRRQTHGRQLQSAAKADALRRGLNPPPGLGRMAAAPAPVRSQTAQNRVGNHGGKGQIQQSGAVRHANLEAQAKRLLGNGDDARHLGLHLPALEAEAQAHLLPSNRQLAAYDLDDAPQNRLFNIREFAQRPILAVAAQKQIDDRWRETHIEVQYRERTQRLQPHRGNIADLGNPEQKLIELNLFS